MIWQIDFCLLIFLVIAAFLALHLRNLLAAVVVLMAYSSFMALLFAEMGAIDVSFTEAVLGAGVTSVLFFITLFHMKERPRK